MTKLIAIVLSYLVGSIPFGLLISKHKGVDLSKVGSGNIGATNVYRALGLRFAALVFLLDVLKGFVGTKLIPNLILDNSSNTMFLCGLATMAGAVASVYRRFKGGKGVATGVGVFLGLAPLATAICVAIWAFVFSISRYVSLGSITAASALPIIIYFLKPQNQSRNPTFWLALAVAVVIVASHRSNIRRLLSGQENKIGPRKQSP